MKNTIMIAAAAAALTAIVTPGHAQNYSVTLYEDGNGSWSDLGGNTHPLNGQLSPDPSGGLAGNVLVFTLPFNFQVTGDYRMTEPPGFSSVSDVVRFWANNKIIFYSDIDSEGGGPLADTGLPVNTLTPLVQLQESGVEGGELPGTSTWQSAVWEALPGDPGYAGVVSGHGVQYTFVSEVPEPTTGALIMLFFATRYLGRRPSPKHK
jgi:hypothetical protein